MNQHIRFNAILKCSSPKDSRKDTAKSPKCVMIQLLRLIKHKGFDGDELYLFEH